MSKEGPKMLFGSILAPFWDLFWYLFGNFLDNFLAVVISFPRCVFGMFRYKTLNTSCARKCMKCRLTGHTVCASGTSTQGCGRGRA